MSATVTTTIPVNETGSLIFGVSGVKVVHASIRAGDTVLSYAFPTYTGTDYTERTMLEFFGNQPFHNNLAKGGYRVFVDILHEVNGVMPSLHMGVVGDLKWVEGQTEHTEPVTVRGLDRAEKNFTLVYQRARCGLRR